MIGASAEDAWSSWVADTIAALLTWGVLLTAALLIGYGLHRWGFERGWRAYDLRVKRARVARAWTDAAVETVDIAQVVPGQRQADGS